MLAVGLFLYVYKDLHINKYTDTLPKAKYAKQTLPSVILLDMTCYPNTDN